MSASGRRTNVGDTVLLAFNSVVIARTRFYFFDIRERRRAASTCCVRYAVDECTQEHLISYHGTAYPPMLHEAGAPSAVI